MRFPNNTPLILFLCAFVALALSACSVCRQHGGDCISPLDYGLKKARTGEERYEVLYKAHAEALRLGKAVDYSGIKKIDLVIPKGAKSIPLTERTDFRGATITVTNNSKTLFLFEYKQEVLPIAVNAGDVDRQCYTAPQLRKGLYLLSVTDEKPWVENREGYSYGATRKDIVLIEDGAGLDGPCSPYNNKASKPGCVYRPVSKAEKSFANVVFKRLPGSTFLTKLVKFSYENNVRIENVSITTPAGTLYGDQAICVYDCTNVLLDNITIDGTYSTTEKFGYGISMNNVWNVECRNVKSVTPWGVFGTNNTHQIHLVDCEIDRFDIHCYGKDVLCEGCIFNGTGGIYSSVFGTIAYRSCTFNGANAYINRPDYNAYVLFTLVLKDCIINAAESLPYIINLRQWNDVVNSREELKTKCWPNVSIENLTVNLHEGMDFFELFRVPRNYSNKRPVAGISAITINGLKFQYPSSTTSVKFKLSSSEVRTANRMNCTIDDLHLIPDNVEPAVKNTVNQKMNERIIVNMLGPKGETVGISTLTD